MKIEAQRFFKLTNCLDFSAALGYRSRSHAGLLIAVHESNPRCRRQFQDSSWWAVLGERLQQGRHRWTDTTLRFQLSRTFQWSR